MSVFFTSDLHLGHARIIELCQRPYSSVDEMNQVIIGNWNATVGRNDVVFVLGDVALGRLDETLQLVRQLNGRKHLVPGNHDKCWPGHKRIRPKDVARYVDVGFEIEYRHAYHHGLGAHLCHFPRTGDSQDEDRFVQHRPQLADDEWLIHGHVHNQWLQRGRDINVGVDAWNFTPVHSERLKELIELGPADISPGFRTFTAVRDSTDWTVR